MYAYSPASTIAAVSLRSSFFGGPCRCESWADGRGTAPAPGNRSSFLNATGCARHCVCRSPLTRVGPKQNPPATIDVTVSFTLGLARLRATYRVTVSEATKHTGSCREEFQVEQLRQD